MTRGGSPNPNVSWKHWYALTRWQKRRRFQLYREPYCKLCAERGVLTAAEIVDHVTPHRGRWNDFWLGELQSLCKDCHDRVKRLVELYGYDPRAIDADGWPSDPRHPSNRPRRSSGEGDGGGGRGSGPMADDKSSGGPEKFRSIASISDREAARVLEGVAPV